MERGDDFYAVVAIDLGTANSGYMFSLRRSPERVKRETSYSRGDAKIPTILLLRPDRSFHSFGERARAHHDSLEEEEAQKWFFFNLFKMELHSTKNVGEDTWLKALNEKEMRARDVFSLSLRYFKEQAESSLRLKSRHIRWVLTVPAIWSNSAKKFMRDAAYQAGLARQDQRNRVIIALEPETASLYVRQIYDFRSISEQRRVYPSRLPRAGRYLIVDCGGGTIDCAAHEINEEGKLKDLYRTSGIPWGSAKIDEQFESLLGQLFGGDVVREMKLSVPGGWNRMMESFEFQKSLATLDEDQTFYIEMTEDLQVVQQDFGDGDSVHTKLNIYNRDHGPEYRMSVRRQNKLVLSSAVMKELFDPAINHIVTHLRDLLRQPDMRGVENMFLVGGFGCSPILQNRLQREFRDRMRVIVPPDPCAAALYGAVLYGHNPRVIAERRSWYTYGVSKLEVYDRDKHFGAVRVGKQGHTTYCYDVFDAFVRANQSVGIDEEVPRFYETCKPGQLRMKFGIFRSRRERVVYVSDEGVEKCGAIEVKLKSLGLDGYGKAKVSMKFGDTEIQVTARDCNGRSGNTAICKVEFLPVD